MRDLTGQQFGLLTVVQRARHNDGHKVAWLCRCRCGAMTTVRGTKLTAGLIVSCGCWRADPEVRRAARLKTPRKRRREIARTGGFARWVKTP